MTHSHLTAAGGFDWGAAIDAALTDAGLKRDEAAKGTARGLSHAFSPFSFTVCLKSRGYPKAGLDRLPAALLAHGIDATVSYSSSTHSITIYPRREPVEDGDAHET